MIQPLNPAQSHAIGTGQTLTFSGAPDGILIGAGSGTTLTIDGYVSTYGMIPNSILMGTVTAYNRLTLDIQRSTVIFGSTQAASPCLRMSTIPTDGTWKKGAFVFNTNATVSAGKMLLGWSRITDGAGQVLNTDWSPCYVTTT